MSLIAQVALATLWGPVRGIWRHPVVTIQTAKLDSGLECATELKSPVGEPFIFIYY